MKKDLFNAIRETNSKTKLQLVKNIAREYGQDAPDHILDCLGQAIVRLKARKKDATRYANAALRVALRTA